MQESLDLLENLPLSREWTTEERVALAAALDQARPLIMAAGTPDELRRRAARAYYRCVAREALVSNQLTEHHKSWLIGWAKGRGAADKVLAAWACSEDPHAPLVEALRQARPDLKAKDIAAAVGTVCKGWTLATPGDERDYEPSPRVVRRAMVQLVEKLAEALPALDRWLTVLPTEDVDRRVLHAGSVFAAAKDTQRLTTLEATVPADRLTWAHAVWAGF